MHDRVRATLTFALSAALTLSLFASSASAVVALKVVIIVGPTGAQTDSYRSSADKIADVAAADGADVVKVYSPNATWDNVQAAVDGANIIIYLGHGNGYPNPYNSGAEPTDRDNGWGLNRTTTNGDDDNWSTTMVYCGEKALLGTLTSSDGAAQRQYCKGGINPAPGFVMIYSKACYTPGAGEGWDVKATQSVAFQRVRNYSYPVLKLGAGAYFATDIYQGASSLVDLILNNPDMSYGEIAANAPGYDSAAQRHFDHPDLEGDQVWIQRTGTGSGLDYWYAYAGNPNASFNDPNAPPPPSVGSSIDVTRLAGADRFATAASVSKASFSPGVPVAYVATGYNFPDALAGSAAAGYRGGPTLLVAGDSIPDATASELARLKPAEIVVLGGTAVISESVRKDLKGYATTGVARRLAGANRYETAAAVSADTFAPGVPVAYVATGANFPDALAGTPPAGNVGGPILLVTSDSVPAATANELTRLQPKKIVILGGTSVVSKGVAVDLQAFTTGGVQRLAGPDRYATAVAVSSASFASAVTVFIATGSNFPDALAGGPVAGMEGAPLLLVATTSLPSVVADELMRLNPSSVVILGSTGVVSSSVVQEIKALFP